MPLIPNCFIPENKQSQKEKENFVDINAPVIASQTYYTDDGTFVRVWSGGIVEKFHKDGSKTIRRI